MLKIIFFILISFPLFLFAQPEKVKEYIKKYKDIAILEMQRTGVPASITLAQGILESQFGESDLSKKSNNHFGIKCKNDWLGGKVYADDDSLQECFRKYDSVEHSYRDHSDFLKNRAHYKFLFSLNKLNDTGWAKGLQKAGYATNKDYPQQLLKIINDYNLHEYSKQAIENPPPVKIQLNQQTDINFSQSKYDKSTTKSTTKVNTENIKNKNQNQPFIAKNQPYQYSEEFSINNKKVMYVREGTALLSIAIKNNIPYNNLIKYNDMEDIEILTKGQLIFLEPKANKASKQYEIYSAQKSIYEIAQQNGIKKNKINLYNKNKNLDSLKEGDTIFLQKKQISIWKKLKF